jgi:hypothetical protein
LQLVLSRKSHDVPESRPGIVEVFPLGREEAIGHHHIADDVGIANLGQDRHGLFRERQRLSLFASPPCQFRRGLEDSHLQTRRELREMLHRRTDPPLGLLKLPVVDPPVEGQRKCEPRHGFVIGTLGRRFQCAAKVLALGSNAAQQGRSRRRGYVKAL